ncbi:MAG: pirin family protein [Nevskia sp.]
MISFRPADRRGHAEHGWLDSHHSFSVGSYRNPREMGIGSLRVINDDRVAPGAGFAPHSHSDMEIISYVLEGGLRHRDSTGGSSVLRPGELQLMTAGRGISHSEMNASPSAPVHFLQIWIVPNLRGADPGYQQKTLDLPALRAGFATVAAPAGEGAPFSIHQDARLLIAWPGAGQSLVQPLAAGRRYYLHVARGRVQLGGQTLADGDAAVLDGEAALALASAADSELLLFDLAG